MKSFAFCLILAITCGVALSYNNTTDLNACMDARVNITRAERIIEQENDRLYPNKREIANQEEVISFARRVAKFTCPPEANCYDSKNGITKARKALEKEKDRLYPSREVTAKLNEDVAFYQELFYANCNGTDVCMNVQEEIQRARKLIEKEKDRLYPDRNVITGLESEIGNFKRIMVWRCPANETCIAAQVELNLTRKAIEKEKDRLYPDRNVLEKLEAEATNSSEIALNYCGQYEVCAFIQSEIAFTDRALKKEKDRLYPDRNVVAKLETQIAKLQVTHGYKCNHHSGWRFAEVASRGGRFLAKFLRH